MTIAKEIGDRTRYSVTCINKAGLRGLAMSANWSCYFWDKKEDAQTWLSACLAQPDNLPRLEQIYGPQAMGTFRVDLFVCYAHGEAKSIWVE